MYGGLFGDLPSTKKDTSKGSNSNADSSDVGEDGKLSQGSGPVTKTSTAPPLKQKQGTSLMFAPPRKAPSNKNPSKNFLQMVGKSGTTMAFVPTAALKAKRKKNPPPVAEGVTTASTSNDNSTSKSDDPPKRIRSASTGTDQPSSSSLSSFAVVATTTTRISSSDKDDRALAAVVDIHGTGATANATTAPSSAFVVAPEPHPCDESEPEESVITDPYDPYVPNDLLDHWERLAAKKQRENLERETREALEQQKAMRKRLAEERSELLQTATSGGTVLTTGAAAGRGRGRGLSNLPAWLVEQQRGNNDQQQQQQQQQPQPDGMEGGLGDPSPAFGGMGRGRGRGRGVSNLPAWLVERQRQQEAAAKGHSRKNAQRFDSIRRGWQLLPRAPRILARPRNPSVFLRCGVGEYCMADSTTEIRNQILSFAWKASGHGYALPKGEEGSGIGPRRIP
eukprot:jgi/Psemu1/70621/estExt_Genemark1.C_28890004